MPEIKIKSILLGTDIKKDSNLEFGNDSQMKISTSEIKSSINLDILKKIGDGYFKKLIDSSECKFETKGKLLYESQKLSSFFESRL